MSSQSDEETAEAQLRQYAEVLQALHEKWQPHQGQIPVIISLFRDNVKRIFMQCGRRVGKTEIAAYAAIRWAVTHPNAAVWIVGPEQKQMREVLWESGRLQAMSPKQYVASINNTTMRIRFTNGSFVHVDGADNEDSLRGLRMDFLVIDEFKDVGPTLYDTVEPSLADFDAPCMIVGTPPEIEGHYTAMAHEARTDKSGLWRFYKLPTLANPHIKPEVVERMKARLEARGDADVYVREYLAEFVPGGKRAVFPFMTDSKLRPYPEMWSGIYKNLPRWQFYAALDPGTASVFAGLVAAVEPYKGLVFVMDEVYVNRQSDNSVGKVWPQFQRKMDEVYKPDHPDDDQWFVTVDEAATWARSEILDQFDVASNPTQKAANRKAHGISLIKDLLQANRLVISERCQELLHEMKTYALDKQGNYVKKDDHLIDSLRYLLAAANVTFTEIIPPLSDRERLEQTPMDERRHSYTPAQDMAEMFSEFDPYASDLIN
jgi:hypothetical protein